MFKLPRFQALFGGVALAVPALSFAFGLGGLVTHGAEVVHQVAAARHLTGVASVHASPALPAATGNFGGCPDLFVNGVTPVLRDAGKLRARALCFDGFAVLHSGLTKTPVYVAEVLNRQRIADARDEVRTDVFFPDARLPGADRATLEDYRGSGFDRGHMAPAGDMTDPRSMAQSFSLANMVPQAPENNRKAWASIEKSTRKYVTRAAGNVYVITGPVFSGQVSSIGPGRVWVPSHLFKLVYDASSNRAWAHWLENTDAARVGPPISYAELVRRTGVEWLPGVRLAD